MLNSLKDLVFYDSGKHINELHTNTYRELAKIIPEDIKEPIMDVFDNDFVDYKEIAVWFKAYEEIRLFPAIAERHMPLWESPE